MSRMTKFLKQTCAFEKATRDSTGEVLYDTFGEVQYGAPIRLKCRREVIVRDVQTNTGAILRSSTRYFLDSSTVVNVEDRIDGKAILEMQDYVNQNGALEGYEVYV